MKLRFKTPYKPPYDALGNTNFPDREKSGVYLIKEGKDIVYIGASGVDVYKTIYRHFQSWKDDKQKRVTYEEKLRWNKDRYKVRVIYCSVIRAGNLEIALISKYKPRDNSADDYIFFTPEMRKTIKKADETDAPF